MLHDFRLKDIEEVFRTPIVQQTAFWSEVKNRMGYSSVACNFKVRYSDIYNNAESDKALISDILVIMKQIDASHSVAYVPYGGNLVQPVQGDSLKKRTISS